LVIALRRKLWAVHLEAVLLAVAFAWPEDAVEALRLCPTWLYGVCEMMLVLVLVEDWRKQFWSVANFMPEASKS
jgi:hypothetical protein